MPISHKSKQQIIEALIKPEALSEGRAWPREIKLMNHLVSLYPEEAFWLDLHLGFSLNSLAWFRGEGKGELERAWRLYRYAKSQNENSFNISAPTVPNMLDKQSSGTILESSQSNSREGAENEDAPRYVPRKKESVIAWADSV